MGIVRSALEKSGYQLDPYWYSWGTMGSRLAFENLIFDIIADLSLSKNDLSQKIYGSNEHLTQINREVREGNLKDGIQIFKLLYDIYNIDDGTSKFNKEDLRKLKAEKLPMIFNYLMSNIFKGYSSKMFNEFYQKNFIASKNYLIKSFEELKLEFEFIFCVENFYGIDKAILELRKNPLFEGQPNYEIYLNNMAEKYGIPSYENALEKQARVDKYCIGESPALNSKVGVDYKKIGFTSFKEIHETIYDITDGKRVITGNIIGPRELWIKIGSHDYATLKGGIEKGGIEHMWQNHRDDFERWGCYSIQEAVELILDTISNKKGVQIRSNIVCYKIKDKFDIDDYICIAYEVNEHYLLNAFRLYDRLQSDKRFSNIFELIDRINK